jgi:hypothetical protein
VAERIAASWASALLKPEKPLRAMAPEARRWRSSTDLPSWARVTPDCPVVTERPVSLNATASVFVSAVRSRPGSCLFSVARNCPIAASISATAARAFANASVAGVPLSLAVRDRISTLRRYVSTSCDAAVLSSPRRVASFCSSSASPWILPTFPFAVSNCATTDGMAFRVAR